MGCLRNLARVWKTILIIFVPILALPIVFVDESKEMCALYGLVVMAAYWITEALPLSVTALLPVVIFPMLGVASAKDVARNYIKNASLFGFVCLAFSLCVEKWNLHRRIALRTILLMGSAPKWLMLGFMLPTWFLSLWVNNTSATAMMLPIVSAVLTNLKDIEAAANQDGATSDDVTDQGVALRKVGGGKEAQENLIRKETIQNDDLQTISVDDDRPNQHQPNRHNTDHQSDQNMRKAMNLCICYAASVGGIGSMAGTGTNIIMQGQADEFFKIYSLESGVNFLSWMLCCLPIALICLLLTWAWLVAFFFGPRELFKFEWSSKESSQRTRRTIQTFLDDMGPMKFAEKAVLFHFILLVVLMLSMKFPGGSGWAMLFESGYVKNSVPAVTVLVLTFLFPSRWSRKGDDKDTRVPPLLEWKDIQKNLPWGTIILMGGGYALAFTIKDSGLSKWIGLKLSSLAGTQDPWVIILLLSLAISFMTEVTSNATTASILCPILAQLAVSLHVHPLYFLFPGVLACSLAFMLPVATPPNTLVFATGDIKVKDMIKVGFFLNVICVGVVNLAINTWMSLYFRLDTLPPEMMTTTTTATTTTTTTAMMTTIWTMAGDNSTRNYGHNDTDTVSVPWVTTTTTMMNGGGNVF